MLTKSQCESCERRIREALSTGDARSAVSAAIEAYGPELLGFMARALKSEQDAHEAFSTFCEELLRGIGRFEWRSTFRTWVYAVARNAIHRTRRVLGRQRRREVDETSPGLREDAEPVAPDPGSQEDERLARAVASLAPLDAQILNLRIYRGLSWVAIAGALAPEKDPTRAAAAFRKRFERAKSQLRRAMRRELAPVES